MKLQEIQYQFYRRSSALISVLLMLSVIFCNAQQSKIKCYFNHPVNTNISSGANAVYLNSSFPDTIAAFINRAKYSIDVALYNLTSTTNSKVYKVIVAANAAAARGVQIRWIYNASSSNTGLSLLNTSIQKFASPTINGYIMHNKFLVIDALSSNLSDPTTITGSYNFSDTQTDTDYNNILIIQDKNVTTAYYYEFNKMWGSTSMIPDTINSKFGTKKSASTIKSFLVGDDLVEVFFSPKDTVGQKLQTAINSTNYDLFFGIYAFTDNTIANLIKSKYDNGIRVRGIADNFSNSYSPYATLNPALGSNFISYAGTGIYHNKVMLIDALNPESDPQVFTGSFNWSASAQNSNDENSILIHNASIANQYYQSLCADFTAMGGIPCVYAPCSNANTIFISNIRGNSYQWQVNTGAGFVNISDNAVYNGTNTVNLSFINAPSSWYGYQYRCMINNVDYSEINNLKFSAYWNGSVSTAWENPLNWNCGNIPDANTDVFVNYGVTRFPVLNSSTVCRSLRANRGTIINITPAAILKLTGLY